MVDLNEYVKKVEQKFETLEQIRGKFINESQNIQVGQITEFIQKFDTERNQIYEELKSDMKIIINEILDDQKKKKQ